MAEAAAAAAKGSVAGNKTGKDVKTDASATAPVTIKDASGAVVSGYNNAYVRDGETITLARGQYTVLGGNTMTAVAPTEAKAADRLAMGVATASAASPSS